MHQQCNKTMKPTKSHNTYKLLPQPINITTNMHVQGDLTLFENYSCFFAHLITSKLQQRFLKQNNHKEVQKNLSYSLFIQSKFYLFIFKTLIFNECFVFLNQHIFVCEKLIQCVFFGSFTPQTNIIRPIFNNKDDLIQVVNSKLRTSKIYDNTNDIEKSFSFNL